MTAKEIEKMCVCENSSLCKEKFGVSFSSMNSVSFRMWSPNALAVELLLFRRYNTLSKNPSAVISMNKLDGGVWSLSDVDCTDSFYYKYRIHNELSDGTVEISEVCDIWAYAASADSVASQVTNISDGATAVPQRSSEIYDGTKENYVNPWKGTEYSDALIYELHIRDWSLVEDPSSFGKFMDIAEGLKVVKYIRSLGVTHVQLMPCYDYAQTNDDPAYNWGYNPYNYNVPEGRYVRRMKDGTDAVRQFRALIQKFHKAGIAVGPQVNGASFFVCAATGAD